MTRATVSGRRGAAAGVLIVGGGVVAAATWVGGDHGWAIAALAIYAVLAAIAFVAGRSGDVAAILRVGGDERQRGLDRDAVALSGVAMTAVALVGGIIELGRTGNPGVYGLFCVVAGVAYAVSLFELRRRR
jgi:hypothetical protein